jgi:DNA (cytosine-5)-methyltransferase 1
MQKTNVAPSMEMEPLRNKILAYVKSSPGATYQELATNFQCSSGHVKTLVRGLRHNRLVKIRREHGRIEVRPKSLAIWAPGPEDPDVIHAADLFCGLGGFSLALGEELMAMGRNLERHVDLVGINHDEQAMISWKLNHSFGRECREDITKAQPRKLFPGGFLHVLLASPSCTHHSVARGGAPVNDQLRSHPWTVVRWCRDLHVAKIIVENVAELVKWGPTHVVDCTGCIKKTGKADEDCRKCKGMGRIEVPIKGKEGTYFRAWIRELKLLGYSVDWRILNAASYGDATSRKRFFLVGIKGDQPIEWPEPTHSKVDEKTGKPSIPGTEPFRAAREIINFDLPSNSMFDRVTATGKPDPLAYKTQVRILDGLQKRNGPWMVPFLDMVREKLEAELCRSFKPGTTVKGKLRCATCQVAKKNHPKATSAVRGPKARRGSKEDASFLVHLRGTGTSNSLEEPTPTPTAGGQHLGLCQSVILGQQSGHVGSPESEPIPTASTGGAIGVITPAVHQAEGVVVPSGGPRNDSGSSLQQPLPANLTRQHHGVANPIVMHLTHGGRDHSVDKSLPTVTTAPRGELGVAQAEAVEGFVMASGGPTHQMQPRDMGKELPCVITNSRLGVVDGIVVPPDGPGNNGEFNYAQSLNDPLCAIRASRGDRIGYAEPVLRQFNGNSEAQSVDKPLGAPTTHDRFGLTQAEVREAEPGLVDMLGSKDNWDARSKGVEAPLGTNHAGGVRWGLTQALATESCLVPNFGEAPGQAPRSHGLDEPLPAPTGHGAGGLATPEPIRHQAPQGLIDAVLGPGPKVKSWVNGRPCINGWILEIRFRMLEPIELAASMSFPPWFNFGPTKKEAVKQIGNAVAKRCAQALIRVVMRPTGIQSLDRYCSPHPMAAAA